MVRTKKKEKQEKRRAHCKKKIKGNLFQKYWKHERKVKKPSAVDGLCSSREILSYGKHNLLIRHINLIKRWQQCFQELYVIFVVPWQMANISSYIEWTQANVGISLTFLQLTCVFCCKYICSLKLKFLLKNFLRGMKMKYILCERAWSQCIMGNRKIAQNVLKNYRDGIFL